MTEPEEQEGRVAEVLELRISKGHARLMIFVGVFIIFGAGLLSMILIEPRIGWGGKIPVGFLVLYLIWVGFSFISGSMKFRERPLFVITSEEVQCFEEMAETTMRMEEIGRCDIITRRGIERMVLVPKEEGGLNEGLQIASTVENYEEAKRIIFRRLDSAQ